MSLLAQVKFAPCSQTPDRIVWDGLETLWDGRLYKESWAPNAWLKRETLPTFKLSHDGDDVGEVVIVIAHNEWHIADCILEDRPIVRELVTPGARVSLEARSLKRYEDSDLRLVRHTIADLQHIALVKKGEIPGYLGAVVTSVRELKTRQPSPTAGGWRALVPAGWEFIRDIPGFEMHPGEELIDEQQHTVHRWTGEKFTLVR
jgi:hypothetical protein